MRQALSRDEGFRDLNLSVWSVDRYDDRDGKFNLVMGTLG